MKKLFSLVLLLSSLTLFGKTLTITSPADNSQDISNESNYDVVLTYDTEGETITGNLVCNLIEKNASGANVILYPGIVSKAGFSGSESTTVSVDVVGAKPTADLDAGNYYKLVATYTTESGAIYATLDNMNVSGSAPVAGISSITYVTPSDNSASISNQEAYTVSVDYDTNGEAITAGITCNLIEKDPSNNNINTYQGYTDLVGVNGTGSTTVSIACVGATPTLLLPLGNYYKLVSTFTTSDGTIYEIMDSLNVVDPSAESREIVFLSPADNSGVISNQIPLDIILVYATDGETITSGITCNLIEKNASGSNVNLYPGYLDKTGTSEDGRAELAIDISAATLSKDLPSGNYYKLVATYTSASGAVYETLDDLVLTDGTSDGLDLEGTPATEGTATDKPSSSPEGMGWHVDSDITDEFSGSNSINWTNKWSKTSDLPSIEAWEWDNNANTNNSNGVVEIDFNHNDGNSVSNGTYFTSGIIQSQTQKCYGYYEARIKGARIPNTTLPSTYSSDKYGRGVCPAFWLWGFGNKTVNGVQMSYSEIDVVEMQQFDYWNGKQFDIQDLDLNLHAKEGNTWLRPKQYPSTQKTEYDLGSDPTTAYHTYGIENRPDSIVWYIDGVQVAAQKNTHWHLDMNVTVSLGGRVPFVSFEDNIFEVVNPRSDARADAKLDALYLSSNPDDNGETTMFLDYIKAWDAAPSLWMDYNTTAENSDNLDVEIHFHPGTGFKATTAMSYKLVEKNASGNTVNTLVSASNTSIINKYKGTASVSIPLTSVNPTSSLDNGNYYVVEAAFLNSDEKLVSTTSTEITVTGGIVIGMEDVFHTEKLDVFPNPTDDILYISTGKQCDVSIYSLEGVLVQETAMTNQIDLTSLPKGTYIVKANRASALVVKK